MRFASLNNSNARDYAQAGKSVAGSAADAFTIMRRSGPDYAGLSQVAMNTRSAEKIAAMKAGATMATAGIKAVSDVTQTGVGVKAGMKLVRDKANRVKMAGKVAGIGAVLGGAVMAFTGNEKEDKSWKDKHHAQREALDQERLALMSRERHSETYPAFEPKPAPRSSAVASSGATKSTAPVSGGTTSNLGGKPFDLSKLTEQDFREIGFAVSSEAALNTDDEYGVAANILTRLSSGNYGKSISEIIRAPGQYEGVYTGKSYYDPNITARLMSPEGRAKINEFYKRLDGRTEFKGQSMLKHRVASEDPMFHPKGNFYHYAGQ